MMNHRMKSHGKAAAITILTTLFLGCLCWGGFPLKAQAKEETIFRTRQDTSESLEKEALPDLKINLNALPEDDNMLTVEEPPHSDLKLMRGATRLAGKRWIQSFCRDKKYYYFLQMRNPYKGHLLLTRVRYEGKVPVSSDYMILKGFGHGTNLDCSIVHGKTWLWTGGDCKRGTWDSTTITAFRFVPGKILVGHGSVRYPIRMGGQGKRVSNVYPAVNVTSKKLCVRYTYDGKQFYQIYKLRKGTKINPNKPVKVLRTGQTPGEFQGFDMRGSVIYMIEGSPSREFLEGYDKKRQFNRTIIRSVNYRTRSWNRKVIRGAKTLSFREPEGVKVLSRGRVLMMFVSGTLTNMRANVYFVK